MTRVITLCLVIAIILASATACRRAWRASRPVRGGARVVRGIARLQDQTSRTGWTPTPTPDMAKTAIIYYNRGVARHDLGECEAAITDYDEAIRLQPDHASAYLSRGTAKYAQGQYEAAIADYNQTISLQPDYASAYYNRGLAKYAQGRWRHKAAIADFDEAIRLQPDHASAYHNRGTAKHALGEYAAAIADYDEAIRLQPDNADAYDYRDIAKTRPGAEQSRRRAMPASPLCASRACTRENEHFLVTQEMPVERRAAGERRRVESKQWEEQLMAKKNSLMASPHDGFDRYKCSKAREQAYQVIGGDRTLAVLLSSIL